MVPPAKLHGQRKFLKHTVRLLASFSFSTLIIGVFQEETDI
jgi:hypothetical protein